MGLESATSTPGQFNSLIHSVPECLGRDEAFGYEADRIDPNVSVKPFQILHHTQIPTFYAAGRLDNLQ